MTIEAWLDALAARHLANLTRAELTRALRALSSCYVERREKLASGAALEGAGKRAAFALFYGPLHFLTIQQVLRGLQWEGRPVAAIHDLGCGTGVGGAAWSQAAGGARVAGVDRSAWAVAEATWTYRHFGVTGSARTGDVVRDFPRDARGAILLAYAVNELSEASRAALLERVAAAPLAPLLIVEPIAKKDRGWWTSWAARLAGAGVAEHEWRFPADLPRSLRAIARSAGLDPRELTARTLSRA